ncbi:hypothetical protein [Lonepinella koalarum]|uniref:Uncharacterized protein n=1 Tax=Lonepinella koalarum TaxID=53417 RepID=A0A4R1L050_9PAST|nr:hypothetical protein [Lonepinella koalarum]TCK70337.1 hypothetical protein EV692_0601 [Lonepinella koalarum]
MFKEKGYDEFVNECVRKGREEKQAGLGFTLEQAKASSKQVIERKSQELDDFIKNVVYA